MMGDLMAGGGDLVHTAGVTLRDPAPDEKGRA